MLEKPVVFGELRKVRKRLLEERGIDFPLIEPTFYPVYHRMLISPSFPLVVKIGHHHAGFGKIKCENRQTFDDVKSIVATHGDYCTAEEFIDYDYEIAIQKIGPSIRCFKRESMSWKGNVGNDSINEDVETTEQYKIWIEAASQIFGGLDICRLDLVHDKKTDSLKILELNGTAIGLVRRHEKEDMNMMRDIVIARMSKIYGGKKKKEQKKMVNDVQEEEEEEKKEVVIDVDIKVKEGESNDVALVEAISKIRELEKDKQDLQEQAQSYQDQKKDGCIVM